MFFPQFRFTGLQCAGGESNFLAKAQVEGEGGEVRPISGEAGNVDEFDVNACITRHMSLVGSRIGMESRHQEQHDDNIKSPP